MSVVCDATNWGRQNRVRSSGLRRAEWFLEPAGNPSVSMQLRRGVDGLLWIAAGFVF